MKEKNKTIKVITGKKVQLTASVVGILASVLGIALEYFDDRDYWIFILMLIINSVFLINTLTEKSDG